MKIKTIHVLATGILVSMVHGTSLAATPPSATSRDTTTGRLPGTPTDATADPASEDLENRPMGIAGALKDLARRGIFLRANLIDQYARNTRGGVEQGHSNAGQFNIGADLDLDKLIGTHGSSFHFTVYKDYGYGLNHDTTGTFPKQQYIYKNEYPRWHLGTFAFEQKLLDDRLDIILGRLGTTSYYAKLTPNCQFQAGNTCGVPRVINSEAGYSLLPSATWGINVRYRTTPNTYVETGVYEVNPTTTASNGLDFSIGEANGVTVPVEWGWVERGDFELKFGGYVSTAPRPDPYYNTAGRSLGRFGGSARTINDERKGIYLLGDKVVWRPEPQSKRNLTVFGGVVQQLEDEEIMKRQLLGGAVLTGPFASRPQDTVGFSASMYTLTDKERAFLRDARERAGGHGSNAPHEYAFELNYGWHVSPGVIVMPNIQYIVHPDNSGIARTATLPKNLLAYGINLQLSLGGMLGLGSGPGGD